MFTANLGMPAHVLIQFVQFSFPCIPTFMDFLKIICQRSGQGSPQGVPLKKKIEPSFLLQSLSQVCLFCTILSIRRKTHANEYLTTKVHHACGHRLNPIASQTAERPVRAVRGLCWCQTCTKFVSRDGNAAHNILGIFKTNMYNEGTRPHALRFGQPRQVVQIRLKLP